MRARASFGPETCAQAANLTAGHHIPVYRSTLLLCQLAGIAVSTGWMAGIRGRAASLVEASGFMDRVRELLKTAPAVHADETPARAAGGTRYVHLACTRYLTCMHTGDRSADAIDAGGVLPGYPGVIVRDGYAGYGHLTDALHAWCGVHLLRDLKGLYDFEPSQQRMGSADGGPADRGPRRRLRPPARPGNPPWTPSSWRTWSPATGHSPPPASPPTFTGGPRPRRTPAASPAGSSASRTSSSASLPALTWTSSPITKQSGRSGRSRSSSAAPAAAGGPSHGLADFAIVQSYLSTAAKWGISKLDALRDLFNGHAWLPPGLEPSG